MKLAEFLAEYIENDVDVVISEDVIQAGIEAFAEAEDAQVLVVVGNDSNIVERIA